MCAGFVSVKGTSATRVEECAQEILEILGTPEKERGSGR